MKKQLIVLLVVLLAALVLAGCAPSWQAPIMGPEVVSRPKAAPVGEIAGEEVAANRPPLVIVVTATAAPAENPTVPVQAPTRQAATEAAPTVAPAAEPAPTEVPVQRIGFEGASRTAVLEGVLPVGGSVSFVFAAQAEQMATLAQSFVDAEVLFSLSGVDSGKPVAGQQVTANLWSAILPQTQDYLLVLTAPDGGAAGVTEAPYRLELAVENLPFGLPPPRPELVTQVEALVYAGPGREFDAVHALPPQRRAEVIGRNADNSWLAISGPGDGSGPHVWIAAEDVVVEGDVQLVPVLGG